MKNSRALYQEVILDHNKSPRNYGSLKHPSHHAKGNNPLCGDMIEVSLNLNDECINDITFHGAACAICKASSSMMTDAVKGKTRTEAETLIHQFTDMATGKLDLSDYQHIGRLKVFAGIADLPARVKCAVLPWHTLKAAFNAINNTSTEAEHDPIHSETDGT